MEELAPSWLCLGYTPVGPPPSPVWLPGFYVAPLNPAQLGALYIQFLDSLLTFLVVSGFPKGRAGQAGQGIPPCLSSGCLAQTATPEGSGNQAEWQRLATGTALFIWHYGHLAWVLTSALAISPLLAPG